MGANYGTIFSYLTTPDDIPAPTNKPGLSPTDGGNGVVTGSG